METRHQCLRERIAALRGTRKQAVLYVLSCFLRAVRLALHLARSLIPGFLMRMWHRLNAYAVLCCVMPCLALQTQAQTQAQEDLNALYQLAVTHNADYRAALANTEAEREELTKAKALFYPKVQLGLMRGKGDTDRTTQTSIGAVNSDLNYTLQNYNLSVRQPLFNKETMAIYGGAKSYVSEQESLLAQENAKLILKLVSVYLETLYSQERVSLQQSKIEAVSQQLQQAEQRYRHGSGTVVEVSEAQSNLDVARAEEIQAANDLLSNQQSLQILTGVATPLSAGLVVDGLNTFTGAEYPLDRWLALARQHHPELAAANAEIEVARKDVEKKQAGHYPTLDLVGIRSYSENDSNNTLGSRFDTTTIALQMNVPLFAGGYVNANVRQSASRLTASEESMTAKSREIEFNVRKYYQSLLAQQQAINAYRQAVQSARVALDGTQKGFLAGFKTNHEVLDAQQKLFTNQLSLTKAYYSLISDWANLQFSSGLLTLEALNRVSQLFIPGK
ncbi:outer membrane protein, protease secretion system [Methylophilus rhizosphaerae]|uniref:Outer membrane protein, protease secretion system n=1 Tax=Methylophilus rhizosphaerae TaxID=492660 RepID=A0A1G8ZFQ7_9PROT|nr:TolC family outer membrane protein [Methylophilus rhizosphaerae]SDK13939.1 outer membrane protein, protease secretion system [Methylophilus rhizosphaerae]